MTGYIKRENVEKTPDKMRGCRNLKMSGVFLNIIFLVSDNKNKINLNRN